MPQIMLIPLYHRGAEQIGIFFSRNGEVEKKVRTLTGVKWSQTNRCWYVPLSKENYNQVKACLATNEIEFKKEKGYQALLL